MLTSGICVFCHYGIEEWDSNGRIVLKREAYNHPEKVVLVWGGYLKRYCRDLKVAIKRSSAGAFRIRLEKKLARTERLLNSFAVPVKRFKKKPS